VGFWPEACWQRTIRAILALSLFLADVGVHCADAQAVSDAAPVEPVSTVTRLFTTDVVSQDVFRGYLLGGASIEPSLDFSNSRFDIGEWSNSTVSNRLQGASSTELEIYGSFTVPVRGSVSLQPGFTLYTLPWGPGFEGGHRSSIEPNLELNLPLGALRLTPTVYDDLVLRVLTVEANAAYSLPLRGARTELDFTATLGSQKFESEPANDGRTWSTYWLLGVAAPFKVGRSETVTLAWSWTGIDQGVTAMFRLGGGSQSERGFATLSFAVRF
jgi:hypothetical protein